MNPITGGCRRCGGQLDIIDAGIATANVACSECGDTYIVDTDNGDRRPDDTFHNLEEEAGR